MAKVVVGSGGVGKSCLTVRFLKDEFTNDYDPTIGSSYHIHQFLQKHPLQPYLTDSPPTTPTEENYRKYITVDTNPCTVNIIDTAGQHEYTALRDQHLKDGKGFLLVFALNDKTTFEEVKQLREQIVKLKDTKRVPLVDLPENLIEVDEKAVEAYCTQMKIPYLRTSAKENICVSDSFHDLVRECRKYFPANAASPTKGHGGRGGGGKKKGGKDKEGGGGKCVLL
ncbi:hypothetical protein HK097_004870 [Rhizophlyctis rosea]|uniref:Uncharacterized protein n=1 Tax=Rhizophlyctis rosea TaxID=64517 RepID=A0AAD5SJA7_9FUNG|nr:hypothetical protein HK097_004870 [Rhizophlyctis rosea]